MKVLPFQVKCTHRWKQASKFDVLVFGLIELHVLSHPELSLTRLEDISLLFYSSGNH